MTKLCYTCEHKDVCKYCEMFEELEKKLVAQNFGGKYEEIFSVKLICNKYSMEPSELDITQENFRDYLKQAVPLTGIEPTEPYYTYCTNGSTSSCVELCKDDLDE